MLTLRSVLFRYFYFMYTWHTNKMGLLFRLSPSYPQSEGHASLVRSQSVLPHFTAVGRWNFGGWKAFTPLNDTVGIQFPENFRLVTVEQRS